MLLGPLTACEQHTTPQATLVLIDQLLAEHTYDQTVTILNDRGLTGGWGKPFSVPRSPRSAAAR